MQPGFFLIAQQAPQGEGILSYIHNGVTSVNTLADATVPEKILLAAFQLEEEGKSPFSAEDLIVASWKRFPKTLGLKGYAELYPDSNKVLSSIMGVKGLVRRHWLDKKGQKLYSLTRDGTHIVHKLQQGDETPAVEPSPRLSREQDKLLLHLLGAPATRKYDDDRRSELTFLVPTTRWLITPASRRTLKWWVQVDFTIGRLKLLQARSPPAAARSATILRRIGSLNACRTPASSIAPRSGCGSGSMTPASSG